MKNKIFAIATLIIVIVITIGAIQLVDIGVDLIRKKLNLENVSEQQLKEIVETTLEHTDEKEDSEMNVQYPDFSFYQQIKKVVLVSSTISGVDQNDKVYGREYRKLIKTNGKIANAYLFVNVSVDYGKPLKVWDSIYVSLRRQKNEYLYYPIEGHLLRKESLPVPATQDATSLLYDLSNIPFTSIPYSDDKKPEYKNWFELLKNADIFQFETFLSTKREGGIINEISIGYECEKETPNCSLEVIEMWD